MTKKELMSELATIMVQNGVNEDAVKVLLSAPTMKVDELSSLIESIKEQMTVIQQEQPTVGLTNIELRMLFQAILDLTVKANKKVCSITQIEILLKAHSILLNIEQIKVGLDQLIKLKYVRYFRPNNQIILYGCTDLGKERFINKYGKKAE